MGRRKKMPKEQRQAYVEKKAAKREFLLKKRLLCRAEKAAKRQLRAEQKKAARAAFQVAPAPEGDIVPEEPMPIVEAPANEA